MYKAPVLNRYINIRNQNEENNHFLNKLSKVKATIDIKCPESFTFYKVNLKKNKTFASSKNY